MEVVLEVLLNLLLGLRAMAQAFKRSIQLNEPFRDHTGTVLAIGAMLRIRVDEFTVATDEVRRRTVMCGIVRNFADEKEDGEAFSELELLHTNANEPVEALKSAERVGVDWSRGGSRSHR